MPILVYFPANVKQGDKNFSLENVLKIDAYSFRRTAPPAPLLQVDYILREKYI